MRRAVDDAPDPELALDELVARQPFPVHGLYQPATGPAMLGEAHRVNGQWAEITLAYGRPDISSGPLVLLTTFAPGRGDAADDPQTALRGVLERERVRRNPPPRALEPTSFSTLRVLWGDAEFSAPFARRDHLWALQTVLAGQRVVAVGRGCAPQSLRLARIDDLSPFLNGRKAALRRLRTR
ncbi:hypothetical protein ACFU99_03240 [Streptomyces sp. NPDC057654]|uniref:hypothetical protein n=1 Tax=Streptomyces sp. NPDC057654 TaxID=3346196 RepID=UPI0036AF4C7F